MRSLSLAALMAAMLALAACPQREKPKPLEPQAVLEIKPGESVLVEFAADGSSHPSGYRARVGDRLTFELAGAAETLGPAGVLVMVGRTAPQIVRKAAPQRVDLPGAIVFRIADHALKEYDQTTVQVRITNHAAE